MPEQNTGIEITQPNISPPGVSLFTVTQTKRTMKCYGITEEELQNVGVLNTLSTICFSLGAVFFTLFIEKLINYIENKNLSNFLNGPAIVLLLLSLALFLVAGIALKNKRTTIKRIKEQSETV